MLPYAKKGDRGPVLVLMHLLGSSKNEWTECVGLLSQNCQCITLDLPGFGDASQLLGYSVEEMVYAVEETLQYLQELEITLVGHSLSGKVAMAIAAGKNVHVSRLILVAPSPPSPEPMTDDARQKMLAMKMDRISATAFLDGITDAPLKGGARELAIDDFIRCSPSAWNAWLEKGSREDWTQRVGIVTCAALVITGANDPSLSAEVQQQTTMVSLADGRIEVIPECGHLLPLEAPDKLASLISSFVTGATSIQ